MKCVLVRRLQFALYVGCTLVVAGSGETGHCQHVKSATQDFVQAAIVGSTVNRNSFPFYRCKYRITRAEAESFETARAGKWYNAYSYDIKMAKDEDRICFLSSSSPPPDLSQAVPMANRNGYIVRNRIEAGFDAFLSGGGNELVFDQAMNSINIYRRQRAPIGMLTPLGMGLMEEDALGGPEKLIEQVDKYRFRSGGTAEVDGQPTAIAEFTELTAATGSKPLQPATIRYSLDMFRGQLPIRITLSRNGRLQEEAKLRTARECSNQRWFPTCTLLILAKSWAPDVRVIEIRVLELEVEKRPAFSEFAFKAPAGIGIVEPGGEAKSFGLSHNEEIHVDDIPKLFAQVDSAEEGRPKHFALELGSGRGNLFAIGLTAAIAGTMYIIGRRYYGLRLNRHA